MQLRSANAGDAPAIRRLLEASELPTADLTDAYLDDFLVLHNGDALLAVGGLERTGKEALLRSVAVAKAARGTGLGRQMVSALEIHARQHAISRLFLLTTTAASFFESLGYRRFPRESAPLDIRDTQQFSGLCPSSSSFMVKDVESKVFNVLFLCTGNSARSILAEAIMNSASGNRGRFRAHSAGSHPKAEPNPYALALLSSNGISTTGLRSKSWDEFAKPDSPPLDFVFTVCDQAAGEPCPFWPGQPMTAHWGVPDPAAVEGTDEEKSKAFLSTLVILKRRIDLFLSLPMASIDSLSLERRVREIGNE